MWVEVVLAREVMVVVKGEYEEVQILRYDGAF